MNHQWMVSRREWLKRVGAAAAIPPKLLLPLISPSGEPVAALAQSPGVPVGTAPATLTAAESETLRAIAARLIPTDGSGPGATEARADQYIDRALGGALASFRETYRTGLAALDRYALSTKSIAFARLSAADQDALLRDVEQNVATGFPTDAAAFFNVVLSHTIQGTFCDPYYGGNANFAGWDLIGYPGVRLPARIARLFLHVFVTPRRQAGEFFHRFVIRRVT